MTCIFGWAKGANRRGRLYRPIALVVKSVTVRAWGMGSWPMPGRYVARIGPGPFWGGWTR